jgi:hypothetical protein
MRATIKLWADYGSWPIWDEDDAGAIDPSDLPLNQETINRLHSWQASCDATLNHEFPQNSKFLSEEEENSFEQEGISLWNQLRHELEAEYQVTYQTYYKGNRYVLKHPDELKAALISGFHSSTQSA